MADRDDYLYGGPANVGSTVSSLLERVGENDQEAWDRMAALYYPVVYDWCRRQGLRREDAFDVIQEVFKAVAAGIHKFQGDGRGGTFRGWMWGITRHKIIDYWRRQERHDNAAGGSDALQRLEQHPDSLTDDASEAADKKLLAHRALELLRHEFKADTWRAVWRVVVEGDTAAEVAADLGMTPNAVYKAKARVLSRIRDEMGELLE